MQDSGKSGILLQIKKAADTSGGDLTCYVFSLEDAVAHLSVTDPSSILTNEKKKVLGPNQNGKVHVGKFFGAV